MVVVDSVAVLQINGLICLEQKGRLSGVEWSEEVGAYQKGTKLSFEYFHIETSCTPDTYGRSEMR